MCRKARPPASPPIANSAAANEIHPTRARWDCRRGGGFTGLRALTGFETGLPGGFDLAGTSTWTVEASHGSPFAGPAARDARRRTRCVVVWSSVTTESFGVSPLERPWIKHQVHPVLAVRRAAGAGRENTSAARRVHKGAGALVIGGVSRAAGLRLRAGRWPPR